MTGLWALAAAKEYGSKVQKLKRVCKAATIAVPPSVYTRVTSEQDVIQRLKDLLSRYGLAKDSSAEEVARVKRKLKKERDLDGELRPALYLINGSLKCTMLSAGKRNTLTLCPQSVLLAWSARTYKNPL